MYYAPYHWKSPDILPDEYKYDKLSGPWFVIGNEGKYFIRSYKTYGIMMSGLDDQGISDLADGLPTAINKDGSAWKMTPVAVQAYMPGGELENEYLQFKSNQSRRRARRR